MNAAGRFHSLGNLKVTDPAQIQHVNGQSSSMNPQRRNSSESEMIDNTCTTCTEINKEEDNGMTASGVVLTTRRLLKIQRYGNVVALLAFHFLARDELMCERQIVTLRS